MYIYILIHVWSNLCVYLHFLEYLTCVPLVYGKETFLSYMAQENCF